MSRAAVGRAGLSGRGPRRAGRGRWARCWELSQLPAEHERQFETEHRHLDRARLDARRAEKAAELTIGLGLRARRALGSVLLLVVTGVGFLIHVYSVGYMAHERGPRGSFLRLHEPVHGDDAHAHAGQQPAGACSSDGKASGLCSYLLIGFFYDQPFDKRTGLSCADAGRKAFLVNRIGDFAFLIGMLYLDHGVRHAEVLASSTEALELTGTPRAGVLDRRSACCCSSAPAASRRRSRCTSGCPTPWPDPRRSRR